jgi:hypothetical protein
LKSSSEEKDKHILAALKGDLDYCLDTLKINKYDVDTETRIKELYAQNVTFLDRYHKRIVALKIIADFIPTTYHTLSQSQLYDFLMLSTAVSAERISEHKRLVETNDIVFKIYRDIMENYESASEPLKVAYPWIIVDVVAVLNNGIDLSGKEISVYGVYDYYLSRKSNPIIPMIESELNVISDEGIHRPENNTGNTDLIQSLVRVTGRNTKQIEESLARLSKSDTERIRNLCINYPKVDKYCKLVASDRNHFIHEIERERYGRKLTKYQIRIAATSIRKVRKYIENILDGKFVAHTSHGINHTKHNLEYGYQVMGLIDSSKRRGKETSSTS